MKKEKKKIREKGKVRLSKFTQEFNKGDAVAVTREISMRPRFPKRLQGRTGYIQEKRGEAYIVKINDQNSTKKFIIEPIHLKKIKQK